MGEKNSFNFGYLNISELHREDEKQRKGHKNLNGNELTN